jgi:hypothetical protein
MAPFLNILKRRTDFGEFKILNLFRDAMEKLVSKVRDQPDFQIAIGSPQLAAPADEGPRDMLEAAKAMCAALKGLNFAIDQ